MWKIVLAFIGFVSASPLEDVDFTSINSFGLKLLEETYGLQKNFGENVAISPFSVWNTFSLLTEAASNETYKELVDVLKLPDDLQRIRNLHSAVGDTFKSNSSDVTLIGKSVVFADLSLKLHPKFCQSVNSYNVDVYSVNATNITKLAEAINYHMCLATQGVIQNAVKPGNLEDLQMLLVDALYFKANWTEAFDPEKTVKDNFFNSEGKIIGSVNMMTHKAAHNLADISELSAQVLEMTYGKNEDYGLLILLPFEGVSIRTLLNNLATKPLGWMKKFKARKPSDIILYVPRFTISSYTDMIPALEKSGIKSIFSRKNSSLSGISDSKLFVSSTVQSVDLEVSEVGTIAASVTVNGFQLKAFTIVPTITVNREFVYLIVDKKTDLILFSGVYTQPSVV